MNKYLTNATYLFLIALLTSCAEQSKEVVGLSPAQESAFVTILHFIYVELGVPIFLVIIAIFAFKIQLLRNKIQDIRVYFGRIKMRFKFKKAYEDEDRKRIREDLINNALNEARSTGEVTKRNAIEQLSQFSEDKAVNGLINILASENSSVFRKIIIEALYNMIHNQK